MTMHLELFALLLLSCAAHRPAVSAYEQDCFAGVPHASEPVTLLENPGYVTGYSEERRNPLWGSYRLTPIDEPQRDDRPSHFGTDHRTSVQVSEGCYDDSGFDRGHNVPNAAIDHRYGADAQRATFLMSNVSPQRCELNRGLWRSLESLVDDEYATLLPGLVVISGPIFDTAPERIGCAVEVPVAFYKVIVDTSGRRPRVLALVLGQDDAGSGRRVSEFVTTVDCVEQLTGLDLLPDLPDGIESRVESSPPDPMWNVDAVLPRGGCGSLDAPVIDGTRVEMLAACR
jgi:endonuclease G